jgi:hypothetical protein
MRMKLLLLLGLASLSLGACATDGAYAGGGVGLGFNDAYYDPSACWNYGFSDFGFAGPYCGWYDGYFYPGSGIYVYGRDRTPHIWSDPQKSHWTDQREQWHGNSTLGARSALGIKGGSTVSRPIAPHEMGQGMGGFGGHFGGGSRGGGGHGGGGHGGGGHGGGRRG